MNSGLQRRIRQLFHTRRLHGSESTPSIRSLPTFFTKSMPIRAYLLTVLAITYVLALAFYPFATQGLGSPPYLGETYVGCIGISVFLSGLALLSRSGSAVAAIAFLRSYALIVLGYGLGAYLSTKLVIGIGLMVEICVLSSVPLNLWLSSIAIAVVSLAQAFPVFFGLSSVVGPPSYPRLDELAVFCLVLSLAAMATAWIDRMAAHQEELNEALRIQVTNIDTLAELNRNLQGYARTVEDEAAERERNRISREIHDISGYIFTNLIALMDAAGSMPRDDYARIMELLLTARKQAQEGLQETRSALRKLRAENLRLVESAQAIHKIVAIFRTVAGIDVDLNLGNLPHRLPGGLSLALYRTVQEALTNAVRHGRATRVRVNFWVENSSVLLSIADDGKGAFEVVKGIGISGMEERIGALGGSVEIGRTTEGGFLLNVRAPLAAARVTEGGGTIA
ncbi:MAG TPA: sensor histidine kinase [Rectinemataceae bacterium]|nr:sensor histidine kinase [Rectinemataceae bacterium]